MDGRGCSKKDGACLHPFFDGATYTIKCYKDIFILVTIKIILSHLKYETEKLVSHKSFYSPSKYLQKWGDFFYGPT